VGAALLVARLGGRPSARWIAGVAFGGGAWFLGLIHAWRHYFGMAWLPWVLVGAAAVAARPGGRPGRAELGLAVAVAGLALAGEPVTLALGVGAIALALLLGELPDAPRRRAPSLARGALAVALGLGLAAVQLLPALARLADSQRGGGLPFDKATLWSMPPIRFAELVLPRLFGDPTRFEQGLHFGWKIHDKSYPYLFFLTPGALLVVFGISALLARRVPWRRVWIAGSLVGGFLALGRNNPVFTWMWMHLPGLDWIRYPEKFFLLPVASLLFAGALGWGRLLDERAAGRRGESDLPLALAGVFAAGAGALALALALEPQLGTWYVTTMGPLDPGSPETARAAGWLRGQAWLATALYGAVALIALAARRPSVRALPLSLAALAVLVGDQLLLGHRLLKPVPAETYTREPQLAQQAHRLPGRRIWSNAEVAPDTDVWLGREPREFEYVRSRVERLDPSTGAIWGLRYVLARDFDLTLTPSARRALAMFDGIWRRHDVDLAYRYLGAWGTAGLVLAKARADLVRDLQGGAARTEPAVLRENPYFLPEARFVGAAAWHGDAAAAERAALADGLPVNRREYLIGPPRPAATFGPARVVALEERGDRTTFRYRATTEALLVVATTFDRGWRASVAGRALPIHETALGMLAVEAPAGEHALELVYRDPWLRVGGAISALAALAALWVALRGARRGRGGPPAAAA
jgi:hypothetical protein